MTEMKAVLISLLVVLVPSVVLAADLNDIPEEHLFFYSVMEADRTQNQLTVFGTAVPRYRDEGQSLYQYEITYENGCQFVQGARTPAENYGTPLVLVAYLPDNKLDGSGGDALYAWTNADGRGEDDVETCDIVRAQSLGLLPDSYTDYLMTLNGISPERDTNTPDPMDQPTGSFRRVPVPGLEQTEDDEALLEDEEEVVPEQLPVGNKIPPFYWYLAGGLGIAAGLGWWLLTRQRPK